VTASSVRCRQERLLGRVGTERGSVQSIGRAAATAETGHCGAASRRAKKKTTKFELVIRRPAV
jgi:hypothetical protein